MLSHHHCPVSLLFTSTNLPVWSGIETVATLYERDQQQFHLILTEPPVPDRDTATGPVSTVVSSTPRLLWLEFSPYRATLTMQCGQFSYRHSWQRGLYGYSRYSLTGSPSQPIEQLCLRNFTRDLTLRGGLIPTELRIEYELWSQTLQLGHYVVNLEIRH